MPLCAVDSERDVLIKAVIERGIDDVVGRREAKACIGLQQGKVLKMRIAVTNQYKDDETAKEARKIDFGADRVLLDDGSHILIGGIVFAAEVASLWLVEDLGEVFEPKLAAVRCAVKARDNEPGLIEHGDGIHRGGVDLALAEQLRAPAKAQEFIAHRRADPFALMIELHNEGRKPVGPLGRRCCPA